MCVFKAETRRRRKCLSVKLKAPVNFWNVLSSDDRTDLKKDIIRGGILSNKKLYKSTKTRSRNTAHLFIWNAMLSRVTVTCRDSEGGVTNGIQGSECGGRGVTVMWNRQKDSLNEHVHMHSNIATERKTIFSFVLICWPECQRGIRILVFRESLTPENSR